MFEKLIDNKKLGGASCIIWKNGQVLYQDSHGLKKMESNDPMTTDTIFRISSMTKPITSVAIMMLYEEGKLDLLDPITKWFPQFDDMKVMNKNGELEKSNRIITIFDLLTHTSGFTYSEFQQGKLKEDYISVLGGDIDTELTTEQWVNGLAGLPLVSQPGETFTYGKSTDLLGILISTIEGKSLGKVLEEKIFTPLAMTDTFFDVPNNKKDRCASNIGYDEWGNLVNLETVPLNMAMAVRHSNMEFESGGQGLWSTAADYLKFAKIFVEKGTSDSIQVLKQETVELMCSNQLTSYQREHSKLMGTAMFKENHGFGLGLAVVTKENKYASIPCAGSVGAVGWPGAYGGWWTADPVNKTISIFLTHSMTTPEQVALGIGFELYEAIDIFSAFCKQKIESAA